MEVNIYNFFSEVEIEQIAKETGLVTRKSPISGFKFLLTFTNGLLNEKNSTLSQLAAFLNNSCGLEVSPQAVDQKINEAGKEFLKICFRKAVEFSMSKLKIDNDILSKYKHIYIIDSTNFALHPKLCEIFKGTGGGASVSSLRIQFVYDFLAGQMYLEIGDVRLSDQQTLYNIIKENKLNVQAAALFIADLGYFKKDSFDAIDKKFHDFISRLKQNVKVYGEDDIPINIPELLKKTLK